MRAQAGLFKGLNPTVTVASKLLVIGFVVLCAVLAEQAGAFFQHTSDFILDNFKWFYLSLVSGVLGLLLYLMVSRFGISVWAATMNARSLPSAPGSPCCSAAAWVSA